MYQLNGFRRSIPPKNRRRIILIENGKQEGDGFVGELNFYDDFINTFCEIRLHPRGALANHTTLAFFSNPTLCFALAPPLFVVSSWKNNRRSMLGKFRISILRVINLTRTFFFFFITLKPRVE